LTNLDLFLSSLTNVNFLMPLTNLVYLEVTAVTNLDEVPLLPQLTTLDVNAAFTGSANPPWRRFGLKAPAWMKTI
jgi:hypothetical protein